MPDAPVDARVAQGPPPPVAPLIDREDALDQASGSALDVAVVGGGITGAGIALDAASRGLTVALLEREDLASGTSSRSSKLVHGGLRYLQKHEFGLVHEAVHERNVLRHIAPHLVRPLAFVVPTAQPLRRQLVRAGLAIYDAMAAGRNVRTHRSLDVTGVLAAVPGLVNGIGLGGFRYYDCQTDDARLTLAVAQAARRFGALICSHVEAVGLERFRDRVVGVIVRDRLGGGEATVRARWVVSAAGVWADRVRAMSGAARPPLLTPSKGVHLTFSSSDVRVRDAALIPSGADDGRLVFAIPWGRQVIVGTTDEPFDDELDRPTVTAPEAGYLMHAVNTSFGTSLNLHDTLGGWAGLRPLLRGGAETAASRDLSRRHAVFEDPPGLLTVTGGKLTTYRRMAADVVDRIVAADGGHQPCVTDRLALGPHQTVEHALTGLRDTCEMLGVDPAHAGSLLHRHGREAPAVAAFCAERGEAEPLVGGLPYLRGEVRWAVRRELARSLDDVLQRRMRVSLRERSAGGEAARWTADVLGEELGWSRQQRDRQLATYLQRVRDERGIVPLDLGGGEDPDAEVGVSA
ncbi:MAG TPA: glycerol-3-phosphate dehydrogenase/oxidase [Nitriliruptorales bacterium]|nr:glycerol-3-phosphate dehydrogenase/oxidase [Nitriliruptorales bacterium]